MKLYKSHQNTAVSKNVFKVFLRDVFIAETQAVKELLSHMGDQVWQFELAYIVQPY